MFKENNSFLSVKGVLGRRGFIINFLIIKLIDSLSFLTLALYLFMLKPQVASDFLKFNSIPEWLVICKLVTGIITCGLCFPSIVRRIRDITGESDNKKVFNNSYILLILILVCGVFSSKMPILGCVNLGLFLSLIFKEGKITSQKPQSEIIKFNWGAFFGTWIWGLFNKAPKTLFMLPLLFTAGWLPFMLICGLKGNEWAYKNNKFNSIEEFHQTQSNQAVIWLFLTPILYVVGWILFSLSILFSTKLITKVYPEFPIKLEILAGQYQTFSVETTFSKIEEKNGEYIFSIDPKVWNGMSLGVKSNAFYNATGYILDKKNLKLAVDKKINTEAIKTISKIKIISTFNNEVLCSFSVTDDQLLEMQKHADLSQEILISPALKVNSHPSLP
jgi:hypothetical protein